MCPNFVNADLIAQACPVRPQARRHQGRQAGGEPHPRIFGKRRRFRLRNTLSGRTHINMFKRLKAKGYRMHLFFLWVPGVELSLLASRTA